MLNALNIKQYWEEVLDALQSKYKLSADVAKQYIENYRNSLKPEVNDGTEGIEDCVYCESSSEETATTIYGLAILQSEYEISYRLQNKPLDNSDLNKVLDEITVLTNEYKEKDKPGWFSDVLDTIGDVLWPIFVCVVVIGGFWVLGKLIHL